MRTATVDGGRKYKMDTNMFNPPKKKTTTKKETKSKGKK